MSNVVPINAKGIFSRRFICKTCKCDVYQPVAQEELDNECMSCKFYKENGLDPLRPWGE